MNKAKSLLAGTLAMPAMMGSYGEYRPRDELRNISSFHERRTVGAASERKRKSKRKMTKASKRKNRR